MHSILHVRQSSLSYSTVYVSVPDVQQPLCYQQDTLDQFPWEEEREESERRGRDRDRKRERERVIIIKKLVYG